MKRGTDSTIPKRLQTLADFRYALRQFLHFSEEASTRAGLHPQQYQLLLQIAGAPPGVLKTVAYASDRLALRHNSVVELSKRCEDDGLICRKNDPVDRRRVVLHVTAKGHRLLAALAADHARELYELSPRLIRSLTRIRKACAESPTAVAGRKDNE